MINAKKIFGSIVLLLIIIAAIIFWKAHQAQKNSSGIPDIAYFQSIVDRVGNCLKNNDAPCARNYFFISDTKQLSDEQMSQAASVYEAMKIGDKIIEDTHF